MELGHDFTQKIRAAIKAKLEDLGAYDDNELPDYVVVMVANKKTQAQMTDDLSLFLGENTMKFTSWLQEFLDKLVAIATDAKEGKNKDTNDSTKKEVETNNESSHDPSSNKAQKHGEKVNSENLTSEEKPPTNHKATHHKSSQNSSITDSKRRESDHHRTEESSRSRRSSSRRRHRDSDRKRTHLSRRSPHRRDDDRRYKQARTSTLDTLHHHDEEEEDGEEPKQLSSVVKVSERRSSQKPVATGGTKRSLLLTAMKEAEMSVSRIKKKVEEGEKKGKVATDGNDKQAIKLKEKRNNVVVEKKNEREETEDVNVIEVTNPPIDEYISSDDEEENKKEGKQDVDIFAAMDEKIKKRMLLKKEHDTVTPVRTRFIVTINKKCEDLLGTQTPIEAPRHVVSDLRNNIRGRLKNQPSDPASSNGNATAPVVADKMKVDATSTPPQLNSIITQPFIINALDDEDDEDMDTGEVPLKPAIITQLERKGMSKKRCRFWPLCTTEACPFHHPTIPCKNFPNCSYADECFFVHPACRFGSLCHNKRCSYQHTSLPAPKAPINQCKNHPNCTDMNCTFFHPKPCRFGIGCTKKEWCLFEHPKMPSKNLLSWTAPPLPIKPPLSDTANLICKPYFMVLRDNEH